MSRIGKLALALVAIGFLAALLSSGCTTGKKPPVLNEDDSEFDPFIDSQPLQHYYIRPGDQLSLQSVYNEEFNVTYVPVRADGKITFPVVGDVFAAGKTVDELNEEVLRLFREYIDRTGQGQYLMPGDELFFRFTYNPDLNQRAFVRPDGTLSLLLLGQLQAGGVPFKEFEKQVIKGYAQYIKNPRMMMILLSTRTKKIQAGEGEISVILARAQPLQIFVGGEVGHPQIIEFVEWITPWQALAQAGGVLHTGDTHNVIYITRGPDGEARGCKLDLTEYLKGDKVRKTLYLKHGDVLVVPRTGVAKLNLFVRQYIRDNLPVETYWSFSYLVNRERYIEYVISPGGE